MAAQWTIYSSQGEYLASFKHAEHAGMLMSCICDPGATIRLGRSKQIAWTDGVDGNATQDSDGLWYKYQGGHFQIDMGVLTEGK